ncbi:hypothetical protein [uncultured Legionella sp.]|uniref:hypothetical protein n=1 Tax=uncultured Legionella sp. TaxID=210934 RepID=UPI00262D254D|nr:hypothetical protein [uncultured Legionella sp.]
MSKVKGPKEGDIVTAVFSGKLNGKGKSRFPSLVDTKDLVLLSIKGNEYCTGDYLAALVQHAVNTHSRKSDNTLSKGTTTFLIADAIYWHNLKELPPETNDEATLKAQALNMGNQFFQDNLASFLQPLSIRTKKLSTLTSTETLLIKSPEESRTELIEEPLSTEQFLEFYGDKTIDQQIAIINELALSQGKNFEIMRWNTWINQANAAEKINAMMPLYESEPGLKVSIDEDIAGFVSRHGTEPESAALWRYRSKDYLTEENPSIMWLAAYLEYNFIIYPGKILSSFNATRDFFIVKNHKTTVSDGKSLEDVCSHNPLSLHVPEPNRLVNWLEPDFIRSFSNLSSQLTSASLINHGIFSHKNSNHVPSMLEAMDIEMGAEPFIQKAKISIGDTVLYPGDAVGATQSAIIQAFFSGILFGLNAEKRTEQTSAAAAVLPNKYDEDFAVLFKKFTESLLKIDIPTSEKLNLLGSISGSLAGNKESAETHEHTADVKYR